MNLSLKKITRLRKSKSLKVLLLTLAGLLDIGIVSAVIIHKSHNPSPAFASVSSTINTSTNVQIPKIQSNIKLVIAASGNCYFKGKENDNGASFKSPSNCGECKCSNGKVTCTTKQCQAASPKPPSPPSEYEKCKAAGGTILSTFPERCTINDQTYFSDSYYDQCIAENKKVDNLSKPTSFVKNFSPDYPITVHFKEGIADPERYKIVEYYGLKIEEAYMTPDLWFEISTPQSETFEWLCKLKKDSHVREANIQILTKSPFIIPPLTKIDQRHITQSSKILNLVWFSAYLGEEVSSSTTGTVKNVECKGCYGCYIEVETNRVDLESRKRISIVYGHLLKQNLVKVGDTVNQRQIIARIGQTGCVNGSALLFETRNIGNPFLKYVDN